MGRPARLLALVASAALLAGCGAALRPVEPAPARAALAPVAVAPEIPALRIEGTAPGDPVPVWTLVATLHGPAPAYAGPGGAPDGTVPGSWYGAPSALPVIGAANGFVEVRKAQRPNGSTAWVPEQDVTLAKTYDRIVVHVATTRLDWYHQGKLVMDAPAGVGTPDDPTPQGQFFLTFQAPPPDPGYGPVVLVTSAHSDTITDWEGTGDAIVAIHGPLGADAEIGTTGAAISHGCVRLHDADLARLESVPSGTLIDVAP